MLTLAQLQDHQDGCTACAWSCASTFLPPPQQFRRCGSWQYGFGEKKEKIWLNTIRLPSATGLREPGRAQQQAAKTASWAETQGIGTVDLQTKTFPPLTSVMHPGCWRGGPQPAGRACEGPEDRRHHHKPSTNLREVLPRLKPSGGCQPG